MNLILESMTYRGLAKRSKNLERQEQAPNVTDSHGQIKQVHKYKRRRRFGHSILAHSPATFIEQLKAKAIKYGGSWETVNTVKYRASQYDHVTDTYEKHGLSERYKQIGNHMV